MTPMPRYPQRHSGILDRHTRLDQTQQLITKPNAILRKRHSRRNLSIESVATTACGGRGVVGAQPVWTAETVEYP